MTGGKDIVERLPRAKQWLPLQCHGVVDEAVEEIERLRVELEGTRNAHNLWQRVALDHEAKVRSLQEELKRVTGY